MKDEEDCREIGFFDDLTARCPHRMPEEYLGGCEHRCRLHEYGNLPPCQAYICPLFESDDEEGDHENMRMDNEISGLFFTPPIGPIYDLTKL